MKSTDTHTFRYPDRGDNCVNCDSAIEPDRYLCTVCLLSDRFGGAHLVGV